MQAGDTGIVLQWQPGGSFSLIGASASAVVIYPDGITRKVFSLSISGDGTIGSYTTLTGDFPVAGVYQTQLVANFGGSPPRIQRGTVVTITVGAAL